MKTFLIIIIFLLATPCLAAAGNGAQSDREVLCEMMATQARMGILIGGIGANWRLQGNEFAELGEYGPKLAEAVEKICGRLPAPVAVEAPDFTKKREELLREAAEILGEADSLALKLYEMGKIEPDQVTLLEDVKQCILDIFNKLFK